MAHLNTPFTCCCSSVCVKNPTVAHQPKSFAYLCARETDYCLRTLAEEFFYISSIRQTVWSRAALRRTTHKTSAQLLRIPLGSFISLSDSWWPRLRAAQTTTHRLIAVCCLSSWLALWKGHLTKPLTRRCNTCVCSDLSDTKKDIYGDCPDDRSCPTCDWLDCRLASWRIKPDTESDCAFAIGLFLCVYIFI